MPTKRYAWPDTQPENARIQIAIGTKAHAGRAGSSPSDWIDSAFFAMAGTRETCCGTNDLRIRRLYKSRGVKWHEVYRAAHAVARELRITEEPAS